MLAIQVLGVIIKNNLSFIKARITTSLKSSMTYEYRQIHSNCTAHIINKNENIYRNEAKKMNKQTFGEYRVTALI